MNLVVAGWIWLYLAASGCISLLHLVVSRCSWLYLAAAGGRSIQLVENRPSSGNMPAAGGGEEDEGEDAEEDDERPWLAALLRGDCGSGQDIGPLPALAIVSGKSSRTGPDSRSSRLKAAFSTRC